LYRELLPANGAVLDLMSSWISHLPPEIQYRHIVGLGMNREELAANPRLNRFVVQDLNQNATLPFETASFDAATICVSVDYLIQPVAVLRELGRVVARGGPLVVTFSNRCFPTKVIRAWLSTDDAGRIAIVKALLVEAGNWREIQSFDRSPARGDPLFCVLARSGGEAISSRPA